MTSSPLSQESASGSRALWLLSTHQSADSGIFPNELLSPLQASLTALEGRTLKSKFSYSLFPKYHPQTKSRTRLVTVLVHCEGIPQ